jgi:phosphatidylglycerophosphate synthase
LRLVGAATVLGAAGVLAAHGVAGGAGALIAGAFMVTVTALCLRGLAFHPHDRLGLCNLVTLGRAAMLAVLAALLMRPGGLADDPALAWGAVVFALAGLVLDGVDGWLARRSGLASTFGARFDMEVDAGLAAVLCVLVILSGKAGLWLIPLGFLRYAWVMAGALRPWLTGPLPERFSRKAVCVVQIAALIALLAPVVTPPVSTLIAAAATLALVWSFAVDALWRWRQG